MTPRSRKDQFPQCVSREASFNDWTARMTSEGARITLTKPECSVRRKPKFDWNPSNPWLTRTTPSSVFRVKDKSRENTCRLLAKFCRPDLTELETSGTVTETELLNLILFQIQCNSDKGCPTLQSLKGIGFNQSTPATRILACLASMTKAREHKRPVRLVIDIFWRTWRDSDFPQSKNFCDCYSDF